MVHLSSRLLLALLLLLPAAAVAEPSAPGPAGAAARAGAAGVAGTWSQLGATQQRERVVAISLDFGPDGFPVFAYGWDDDERGTRIPVNVWNGESWIEVFHRTSQFPQSFAEFDLKARNENYYLGLKISASFGSVLNSGFEWRGSYAFHNQLFDYDIEANGDMVMLWISDRATGGSYPGTNNDLYVQRYLERGWSGYPAGPDFGEHIVLDTQLNTTASTVSSLRLKRAGAVPSSGEQQYLAAWVHDDALGVAHGDIAGGFTRLQLASEQAATVNLAVHEGNACAAYHPDAARGEVRVECSTCTAESCGTEWRSLGVAIEEVATVERLAVEVRFTLKNLISLLK